MKQTFYGCASLTELPNLIKWDIHNVRDMSMMFMDCNSLKVSPPFNELAHSPAAGEFLIFQDWFGFDKI